MLAAAGQEGINGGTLGRAKIMLKRANGHSYFAVEQAIRPIASASTRCASCAPAATA